MRSALAVSGILAGVVLIASGCGAAKTVTPTPETVIGTVPQSSTPTVNPSEGNAAAGKALFTSSGCAGCHTYTPAGSNASIGPDLDTALNGKDASFVLESIVNPNAEIAPGFQAGIMPTTFGQSLSEKQLADLVAFLTQPSS
jgi:cytochrome c oxidase subunit II